MIAGAQIEQTVDLPGLAEYGGYVYAVLFDTGLVKVGQTRNPHGRIGDHQKNGRVFGVILSDWWLSPVHAEWKQNEQALMDAARILGGTPISPEYFRGVDFALLTGKAHDLPFTPPDPESADATEVHRSPAWLNGEIAKHCRFFIPDGLVTEDEAIERLTARILDSEPEFGREIIARYVRKRLVSDVLERLAERAA